MNTNKKTMEELIDDVCQWGYSKGIIGINGEGHILKQLEKTQEELIETRDAALKFTLATNTVDQTEAVVEFIDGIGDLMVTIILAAQMMDVSVTNCLKAALKEISGRTGTMVDGMFVKDKPPVVSLAVIDDDIDWTDLDPAKACTLGDETCESCQ